MSYSETDSIIPGVRSTCCDAPVLANDICTKCHDHCGERIVEGEARGLADGQPLAKTGLPKPQQKECVFCDEPIPEEEAARTKAGWAHESCAERVYPFDYGDSKWTRI